MVVGVILTHLGGCDHLHDHGEVLLVGGRFVDQVEHKCLQQSGFGLRPKRVVFMRVRRRGVLDEVSNKLQNVLIALHIAERVVAERGGRVDQVKHTHLIALGKQERACLSQDLGFRVCDDHGAARLQHIRHGIGAGLASTTAADDQHVGVMLMLVAVHADLEVLGQQQVGAVLVSIFSIQRGHIAPAGGAMLRAGACVALVGDKHDCGNCISQRKKQQEPCAVLCPSQSKRRGQRGVQCGQHRV